MNIKIFNPINDNWQDYNVVFVMEYYDYPLNGLILDKSTGLIEGFQYNHYLEEYIFVKLSDKDRRKALITKRLFEWCVGYGWSYDRKPSRLDVWLHHNKYVSKFMFELFYWLKKRVLE